MCVVEDLPLVPTTWIDSKLRCGEPRRSIRARILCSPKRMPNSSSERRCASARFSVQEATRGLPASATRSCSRSRAVVVILAGGAMGWALCAGVPAQVVDEERAQRLAEGAVAAVERVRDQAFRALDVELRLAHIAADRLGGGNHLQQRPEELHVEVL